MTWQPTPDALEAVKRWREIRAKAQAHRRVAVEMDREAHQLAAEIVAAMPPFAGGAK